MRHRTLPSLSPLLATLAAAAATAAPTGSAQQDASAPPRRWQLDEVVVESEHAPLLREQDLVGPAMQPGWTTGRRFLTTEVYVIPDGHADFEAFATSSIARDHQGGGTEWSFSQGVGIGLPNRFQLDLSLLEDHDTTDGHTLGGGLFEVRWALADWNAIWGNPTLALGFETLAARPDRLEPHLLLGGEICDAWVWGANLGVGWELSDGREVEYALAGGISHTIIDEQFALGAEAVLSFIDPADAGSDLETSFLIGPSVQWRPFADAALRCAPLVGIGGDSPAAEIHLNLEWEF